MRSASTPLDATVHPWESGRRYRRRRCHMAERVNTIVERVGTSTDARVHG